MPRSGPLGPVCSLCASPSLSAVSGTVDDEATHGIFRALAAAVRYARRYRPVPISGPAGKRMLGYQIPVSTIPISTANIHSHYEDTETQVVFTLDGGQRLTLFFDEDASCRLCIDADIGTLTTRSQFARAYRLDIAVVPTLGPFEEDEEFLTEETYLRRWANSRRRTGSSGTPGIANGQTNSNDLSNSLKRLGRA